MECSRIGVLECWSLGVLGSEGTRSAEFGMRNRGENSRKDAEGSLGRKIPAMFLPRDVLARPLAYDFSPYATSAFFQNTLSSAVWPFPAK